LLWKMLPERHDLAPLLQVTSAFGLVRLLAEIDHYVRESFALPCFTRLSQFVFSTGLGVHYRRPKAPPKNAKHDGHIVNLHRLIDLPLWAFCMKTGIRVGLPPP